MSGEHFNGLLAAYGRTIRGDENTSEDQVAEATYSAEDARRLVACWNACSGISTDELEEMCDSLECFTPVKELQDRIQAAESQLSGRDAALDSLAIRNQQLVEQMRGVVLEKNKLQQQRDELLKARQVLGAGRIRLEGERDELLEALKIAIRQNECDMVMTGEELRVAHAAIAKLKPKT